MRFEHMEEPDVEDLHRHTFYEIIWVDAGQSRQAIDYRDYQLSPESLFFISPGQLHYFEEWEPLCGGSILFSEDFFLLNQQNKDKLFELSFLDNFYANPLLQPSQPDFRDIRHTIELIDLERRRPDYSQAVTQSLLHVLVAQIQRCVDTQQETKASRRSIILYKQLKNLIDQHYTDNQAASFYASALNVTPHHLNLICRQVTGQTASDVIRSRSLLEAKRLLTFSDLTVSEVALQLNFLDPSYFARVFRSQMGVSPAVFKQAMSEKYRL
ncbi:helix-turn-helix domain-containing protein [Spirosoma sp. HMF3257]|uniref:AraC family transcriptional regulator n=2 Tax=Spirosoma telluris TaxID=2183553 RepID=A0A327NZK5_9BACT|nr:helix-turn-helix domain-containing protein [Spirosoma telluris]RAI78318.1 AraC family transcriptional regulator [Spirosoma telluris]